MTSGLHLKSMQHLYSFHLHSYGQGLHVHVPPSLLTVPITSFPVTPHIRKMETGNEANALPTLNSVNTDSFRYRHATCSK